MATPVPAAAKKQLPDYAELNRRFREAGLLRNQLWYYAITGAWILGLLGVSVALLRLIDNPWIQLFGNGALMAFLLAHVGFVGHDAGHQQIFLSRRKNLGVTWLVMLLSGMDGEWWQYKHVTLHHSDPNGLGDGDIVTPFAFTQAQAQSKQGKLARFIVKHQAWMYYLVILLTGFSFKFAGIVFLLHGKDGKRSRYPQVEWTLLVSHFTLYLGLLFWLLEPWWFAFPFIFVNQAILGFYMGNVFAPNHKGMQTWEREGKPSASQWFLQQILASRDVTSGNMVIRWVINFLYGGLNNQATHHVAQSMPRNNLPRGAEILREFCEERGISYHRTGVWQSVREIWKSFQATAAMLPEKTAPSA